MSLSRSRLHVDLTRHVWRLGVAVALAAAALVLCGAATAAPPPVLTPPEVRSAPGQFIVVAVANPVTGRPGAVGGTAHGYGSGTNYRVSASATDHPAGNRAPVFAHAGFRVADRAAARCTACCSGFRPAPRAKR